MTPIGYLVLAADPAPAAPEGEGGSAGSAFTSFLPLVLIFVIFYFLLIRPQSKDRRKREQELKTVKKHDRVVTNAGLHGTVVALGDSDVVLRLEPDDIRVRVERTALWQIRSRSSGEGDGDRDAEVEGALDRSKEKGKTAG